MEDNHALLTKVLNHHFRERPNVLKEAMREINNYSRNANKFEYEKTLNKLYNLMSDDLPSKILLYFLTMVPLPTQENCQSNVMELMKKTHDSLPENIRPVLLDYLKTKSPIVLVSTKKIKLGVEDKIIYSNTDTCTNNGNDKTLQNHKEQKKICKKLADICAKYIFVHENELKKAYEDKHTETWIAINNNFSKNVLKQCYEVVKDVNKKRKWLRMLEDEDVTIEVFHEEYKDSEILLRGRHLFNAVEEDPLFVSNKLQDVIMNFVNHC